MMCRRCEIIALCPLETPFEPPLSACEEAICKFNMAAKRNQREVDEGRTSRVEFESNVGQAPPSRSGMGPFLRM